MKQKKKVTRFPVQIGNWEINNNSYNVLELLEIIKNTIRISLARVDNPGILLSGGLDSSILVILVKKEYPDIPCFTIAKSFEHSDLISAQRLSKEENLRHYIYIPNKNDVIRAKKNITTNNLGDECVYLAIEFASNFVDTLLATDGIDELMGGYWWHINRNSQFPKTAMAFKYFWNELEHKHLTPMFNIAQRFGVSIDWIYLHPEITNYISQIPIKDRVYNKIGKVLWRKIAQKIGVPNWIIERQKLGFVNALSIK